jgi:hypothetical protein
MVVVAAG